MGSSDKEAQACRHKVYPTSAHGGNILVQRGLTAGKRSIERPVERERVKQKVA